MRVGLQWELCSKKMCLTKNKGPICARIIDYKVAHSQKLFDRLSRSYITVYVPCEDLKA